MTTLTGVKLLQQASTANEVLVDRAVRHAVFLERFKSGEVRKMLGFLEKSVFPDVTRQLRALSSIPGGFDSNRARRLQQSLASMRGTISEGMRRAGLRMTNSMKRFAMSEARHAIGAIGDAIPASLTVSFNTPSLGTLAQIVRTRPLQGKTIGEWFKNVDAQMSDKIRTQIGIGMQTNETLPQLTKRVRAVMKTTKNSAEAVTRTVVNGTGANAREAAYAANSDIIKGVQWLSTLDDRTTLICAGLDGRVFKINEGERPPAHVQCRSTTVPVLKGVSTGDAATRASMNGQVAAKTTYGQWLKKQPLKIQQNVLGKAKADLFRKGKIDITRFTDSKNNVLTLKQLNRVEARIAGKTLPKAPRKGSASGKKLTPPGLKPKKFPKDTGPVTVGTKEKILGPPVRKLTPPSKTRFAPPAEVRTEFGTSSFTPSRLKTRFGPARFKTGTVAPPTIRAPRPKLSVPSPTGQARLRTKAQTGSRLDTFQRVDNKAVKLFQKKFATEAEMTTAVTEFETKTLALKGLKRAEVAHIKQRVTELRSFTRKTFGSRAETAERLLSPVTKPRSAVAATERARITALRLEDAGGAVERDRLTIMRKLKRTTSDTVLRRAAEERIVVLEKQIADREAFAVSAGRKMDKRLAVVEKLGSLEDKIIALQKIDDEVVSTFLDIDPKGLVTKRLGELNAQTFKPVAIPGPRSSPDLWMKKVESGTGFSGRNQGIKRAAKDLRMTEAKLKSEVTASVKEWADDADVYIRAPDKLVNRILKDGRFKSQFETGKSRGLFDTGGRSGVEARMFGVDPKTADAARPIYGYMSKTVRTGRHALAGGDGVGQYGNVAFKLKRNVKARTSITGGDSGDMTNFGNNPTLGAVPANNPNHLMFGRGMMEMDFQGLVRMRSGEFAKRLTYVEAQIFDGVSMSDVAEVIFVGKRPNASIVSSLRRAKIKWRFEEPIPIQR